MNISVRIHNRHYNTGDATTQLALPTSAVGELRAESIFYINGQGEYAGPGLPASSGRPVNSCSSAPLFLLPFANKIHIRHIFPTNIRTGVFRTGRRVFTIKRSQHGRLTTTLRIGVPLHTEEIPFPFECCVVRSTSLFRRFLASYDSQGRETSTGTRGNKRVFLTELHNATHP